MGECTPQNGCHQHLCSQEESQLPLASTGGSPISASGSDPGSFQLTAPALGLRAREILCVPLKSRVSVSYGPLALPKVSPTVPQRQALWGLAFLAQDPQLGSSSRRTSATVILLLSVAALPGLRGLTIPGLCPSCQSCVVLSLSSLAVKNYQDSAPPTSPVWFSLYYL